jgi:peptidoglycan hydrolase-like protein with peptidoglycan-binding domain
LPWEVVLSPALLRQLQRNLADAGYLRGTADGRLTPRTRRALAAFQRDYHLVGTGSLDRATAEALLGRDTLGAYTIAAAVSTP